MVIARSPLPSLAWGVFLNACYGYLRDMIEISCRMQIPVACRCCRCCCCEWLGMIGGTLLQTSKTGAV